MDEVVDQEWVSAAATRNYMARNPLVDWLNLYGQVNGFKQDDELPGYDPRTDFTNFILSQGVATVHSSFWTAGPEIAIPITLTGKYSGTYGKSNSPAPYVTAVDAG